MAQTLLLVAAILMILIGVAGTIRPNKTYQGVVAGIIGLTGVILLAILTLT